MWFTSKADELRRFAGAALLLRFQPALPIRAEQTETQAELQFDSPDSGKFPVDNQSIPFRRAR